MIKLVYSSQTQPSEIRARYSTEYDTVQETVVQILQDVRKRGDEAVLEYGERFDRVRPKKLVAEAEEISAGAAQADAEFLEILERSADNIRDFHARQRREGFVVSEHAGVLLGQRVTPLDRVGLYIPGGTASYPSTVLMNAIPAKLAGVGEIILATPPAADGGIPVPILAAAQVAGVDKIYKAGGAQAVAALAYGTQSIPAVDKITGPGNMYVATAKRQVYGLVDIDMVAGPSEILIIADSSANPAALAADLLAQAEHDVMAASILLTTDAALAKMVQVEVERQLEALPRRDIAQRSIAENGCIVIMDSLEQAACWSDAIAPEHLELCVADPFSLMGLVRHAGSIFLGHDTPEALGDYFAGPNHTLPTNGTARFASPLSVDDFVKKSSFIFYSRDALRKAAPMVTGFAQREGLDAHARSVSIRLEKEGMAL